MLAFAWAAAGEPQVAFSDITARLAMSAPHSEGPTIIASNNQHTITMTHGARAMRIDGVTVYLNRAPIQEAGVIGLSIPDALDTIEAILADPDPEHPSVIAPLVVLDAGHGGEDPGATGHGLDEKRIVLELAHRVMKALRQSDIDVRLTRHRDLTLNLSTRTARAASWGADLFVSLHLNGVEHAHASGVETYILPAKGFPSTGNGTDGSETCGGNQHDALNSRLGYYIQKGLVHHTAAIDRGLKRARFEVLCTAPCPAALVECGFVSNAAEAARLRRDDYQDKIVKGITEGILTYVSHLREAPQSGDLIVNEDRDRR